MDNLIARRTILIGKTKEPYIDFEDPEVLNVLLANGVGDGVGVTKTQAAAVTGTWPVAYFRGNSDITEFNEFKYFTSINRLGGNGLSPYGDFASCTSLTEISIPTAVTYIGPRVFNDCTSLSEITITGIAEFVNYTFNGCTALSKLHIASISQWLSCRMTGTNPSPFHYSTATTRGIYIDNVLVETLAIPNTVTSIGAHIFRNINTITSVSIPSSVTSIGASAFYGCSGLTSLTIPNSVTTIGDNAFYDCSSLTGEITLPSSVTSIGASAFRNCRGLTKFENLAVASFGDNVLNGCSNLRDITIKASNSLSMGNFVGCATNVSDGATLKIKGGVNGAAARAENARIAKMYVTGNVASSFGNYFVGMTDLRIGSVTWGGAGNGLIFGPPALSFFEVKGDITSTSSFWYNGTPFSNCTVHFGNPGVITARPSIFKIGAATRFYVGDGTSAIHDQSVLNAYAADADWSAYASQMDTWSNYVGPYKNNPFLPSEYTELEYVGTNGAAELDTGINGNNDNLEIFLSAKHTAFAQYGALLGDYLTEAYNCWRIILGSSDNGNVVLNTNTRASAGVTVSNVAKNILHSYRISHSAIYIDGVSYSASTTVASRQDRNITLGSNNPTGSSTHSVSNIGLQIHSFYISDNGTKVIDLIPCKRNSDNVAGFYDFVSETFKPSTTNTAFTAGPVLGA